MKEARSNEIMKSALKGRGITQGVLANKLGVAQNALSANMLRNKVSLAIFCKILSALDYDVVVVDRRTGESEWLVTDCVN